MIKPTPEKAPSLYKLLKSFAYAVVGLFTGLQQRNLRIHFLAAIVVIAAGLVKQLSAFEWIVVFVAISTVITAELINSSIEETCNLLNRKLKLDYYDTYHPRNLSAAAVFFAAFMAAFIGLVVFLY